MKYLIFLLVLFVNSYSSISQPGSIDLSYGKEGKSTINAGMYTTAGKLQLDQKMVVGGHGFSSFFKLIRLNDNGNLDLSFGENGSVVVNFLNVKSVVLSDLTIQPDGKIIAIGTGLPQETGKSNFLMARLQANGIIDSSFGIYGIVISKDNAGNIFNYDFANAVTEQADNMILVAGYRLSYIEGEGNRYFFLLKKYQSNGMIDEDFGNGGTVVTEFNGLDEGRSVLCQNDGKILEGGITNNLDGKEKFAMLRLLKNGLIDTTFGINGKVITDFGKNGEILNALALQDDGKILACGLSNNNISNRNIDMALARYLPDGNLDDSFGVGGKTTCRFEGGNSEASGIEIQDNKKIVLCGKYFDNIKPFSDFALARFNENGTQDNYFGDSGKVITDFGEIEYSNSFAIQKNGKILLSGAKEDGLGLPYTVLARYLGDPTRPTIAQIKRWIRNHILHFEDANTNTAYYVIEKSTASNTAFVPVTKITANATATTNYSYTLPETATQSTYRIKAVNKDNSITYSSPISSSDPAKAGVGSFKVYPNPAKDRITVETSGTVQLRLQNSNGRVLLTQAVNGKGSIDISKLPVGVYYVVNTLNGESLKVVKE